MACKEREFIGWLAGRQGPQPGLILGVGDDMAIIEATPGAMLLSSDMLLDGVHFDTSTQPLARIGRKALACGLSDCAAMAVRPVAATVSVALPRTWSLEEAKQLGRGIFALADQFDVAIAGGDTTSWPQPLAIDVTILAATYPGIEPVRRSGARPGDVLCVTGPLGGSLLGHHIEFTPRVVEAKRLAESLGDGLHAMMDISDGLALDLFRLCAASGVGALIDERKLGAVISDAAVLAGEQDGRSALQHALGDGEDFELLLAVDGEAMRCSAAGNAATVAGVPLIPVGQVTQDKLLIRRASGEVETLEPTGYEHE